MRATEVFTYPPLNNLNSIGGKTVGCSFPCLVKYTLEPTLVGS